MHRSDATQSQLFFIKYDKPCFSKLQLSLPLNVNRKTIMIDAREKAAANVRSQRLQEIKHSLPYRYLSVDKRTRSPHRRLTSQKWPVGRFVIAVPTARSRTKRKFAIQNSGGQAGERLDILADQFHIYTNF